MANKKYDYSDELSPSAESASETSKTSETEKATAASVEEMRRQRLEQRNDALANEFHTLKPEIADAHRQLKKLVDVSGAFAGTMLNLHELLKSSFPIRFTDTDRQALQNELHAIADDAVSHIRSEHEKASRDIHRNDNRISMTQTTFWCMIALLLTLATFFAVTVFANVKLLHSEILTEIIVTYSLLIALALVIAFLIYYKRKH